MAYTLAESPSDPLHRKLRPLRYLWQFGIYCEGERSDSTSYSRRACLGHIHRWIYVRQTALPSSPLLLHCAAKSIL